MATLEKLGNIDVGSLSDADQKSMKAFHREIKQISRDARQSRRLENQSKFMTPDMLSRRAKSTAEGDLVLSYGNRGAGVKYTLADLDRFSKAIARRKGKFKKGQGVPVGQVIRNAQVKVPFSAGSANSRLTDYTKARYISTAVLYGIKGNVLSFRTSSQQYPGTEHYGVRIRLEEWDSALHGVKKGNYATAVTQAVIGNVSFECSCGRFRYWYRYLATIGNCVLGPKETGFPKIRNPGLKGVCCKHIVKCLATMQTPIIKKRLEMEMKRQAKATSPEPVAKRRQFVSTTDIKKTIEADLWGDGFKKDGKAQLAQATKAFSAQRAKEKKSAAGKTKVSLGKTSKKDLMAALLKKFGGNEAELIKALGKGK